MAFLPIVGFILSAISTAYSIYKSETQEEPEQQFGMAPPLDTGGFGVPQVDMSGQPQFQRQPADYGGQGGALGQAMASFQPMRLGDVLRPQITMGSEDRRKRRFS